VDKKVVVVTRDGNKEQLYLSDTPIEVHEETMWVQNEIANPCY